MANVGVLGSRVYISDAAIAATVDTVGEFAALTWHEIGLIESLGEFDRMFTNVPFIAIADGRTRKAKGSFDDGTIAIVVAEDRADAGQAKAITAANGSNQDNYGFKVELNNGSTVRYFRGLAMSYRTVAGSVNNTLKANINVEVNSDILTA